MDDEAGLAKVYAASRLRVLVEITALTADVTEAEDIVQEAFTRAAARWDRISGYDQPEAWVMCVATNLARSRWRRLRTATAAAVRLRPSNDVAGLGPDHVALVRALAELPADQRQAVVLHHLLDLPVAEVADRMGAPEGTVKAWLSRSRARLALGLAVEDELPSAEVSRD